MTSVPLITRPGAEPGTAMLHVTAAVEGRDEELLLDTGGSRSRLPRRALTGTWLVEAPDRASRGVFGGAGEGRQARVPSIALGSIDARDVVVDVSDDGDGILGLDVLRGHRLGVRPASGRLHLDEQAPIDRWRPLVQSSRGHPYLSVEWDAVSAVAVWDTGASVTVVDTDFAVAHPQLFAPAGGSVTGTDAHGNDGESRPVRMAPCRIGGRRFAGSIAVTAPIAALARPEDPPFTVILGYPVIAQADWAIDLGARMWGFLDRD